MRRVTRTRSGTALQRTTSRSSPRTTVRSVWTITLCSGTQKKLGVGDFTKIPNGLPGVEDRFQLIYHGGVVEGRISLNRWIELTSTAAAKIFGLYPKKGTIAVGSDADIVVFDPDVEWTKSVTQHHMDVDYSAYEGKDVKGKVETVLLRGRVIIDGEDYLGEIGDGQYIARDRVSVHH